MVEEIIIEDLPQTDPPQNQDGGDSPLKSLFNEYNPKLKIAKDYTEFEVLMRDKNNRKAFFDEFNPKIKLAKDFDEFESVLNIVPQQTQPKQASPAPQQPAIVGQPSVVVNDLLELRNLKKESNRVIKKVGQVAYGAMGAGGVTEGYDDPLELEAKKKATQQYGEYINAYANKIGIEKEYIDKAVSMPSEVPETWIPRVADLLQKNKDSGERQIATLSWQYPLRNALEESLKNNLITKDELNNEWNNINQNQKTSGSFEQKQLHIWNVLQKITNLFPVEKAEKLKESVANDMYVSYANMQPSDLAKIKQENKNFSTLTDDQLIGLAFLKDFKSGEYEAISKLLIDENTLNTTEQKAGNQERKKYVENLGLNMVIKYNREKMQDVINSSLQKDPNAKAPLSEADKILYENHKSKYQEAVAKLNSLDAKYPVASSYEYGKIAQELLGEQYRGYFSRLGNKTLDEFGNIGKSMWDLTVTPFMSEQNQAKRFLQVIGEGKAQDFENNLLLKNQQNPEYGGIQMSDELKTSIDAIKSNKDLTPEQKIGEVVKQLQNSKDWYKKEADHKINNNFSAYMYGVGDITSTIVPYLAAAYVTGGTSLEASITQRLSSNIISSVATSYENELRFALNENKPNPQRTAFVRTAIKAAADAVGDEAGVIRRVFTSSKNSLGAIIAKMDDASIKKALSGGAKNYFSNLAKQTPKFVLDNIKNTAQETAIETAGTMAVDISEGKIKSAEEYAKEAQLGFVNFLGFGTLAGFANLPKTVGRLDKDAFYSVSQDPQSAIQLVDEKIKSGEIEKEKGEQIKKNITAGAEMLAKMPMLDKNGKPILDESKKSDLLFNKLKQIGINEFLKQEIPNELREKINQDLTQTQIEENKLYDGSEPQKTQTTTNTDNVKEGSSIEQGSAKDKILQKLKSKGKELTPKPETQPLDINYSTQDIVEMPLKEKLE